MHSWRGGQTWRTEPAGKHSASPYPQSFHDCVAAGTGRSSEIRLEVPAPPGEFSVEGSGSAGIGTGVCGRSGSYGAELFAP